MASGSYVIPGMVHRVGMEKDFKKYFSDRRMDF